MRPWSLRGTGAGLGLLFFTLLLGACGPRSMSYRYETSLQRPGNPALKVRLAVADFADERPYEDESRNKKSLYYKLKPNDPRRGSYFYREGQARRKIFGLTHQEQDFTPVGRVMRDLTLAELRNTGSQALPLGVSSQNVEEALRAASTAGAAYLLTGRIFSFSAFMNEPSYTSGTSWKAPSTSYEVRMSVSLYRVADGTKLWEFKLEDDSVVRHRRKSKKWSWRRQARSDLFGTLLPPLLTKGAGFALDQLEIDLKDQGLIN